MIVEVAFENRLSIVSRTIIDHYYFFRNTRLRKNAVDRFNDEAAVVIRAYDHGDSHIYSWPLDIIQGKLQQLFASMPRQVLGVEDRQFGPHGLAAPARLSRTADIMHAANFRFT